MHFWRCRRERLPGHTCQVQASCPRRGRPDSRHAARFVSQLSSIDSVARSICGPVFRSAGAADADCLRTRHMQDVLARYKAKHGTDLSKLPEKAVFQLNDTHPTIGVAELMRLLVDENGMEWEAAKKVRAQCARCATRPT